MVKRKPGARTVVGVSLRTDERRALERYARSKGLTMSAVLRMAWLTCQLKWMSDDVMAKHGIIPAATPKASA